MSELSPYIARESDQGYEGFPVIPDITVVGINNSYADSQMTPYITNNQSWWDSVTEMGGDLISGMGDAIERGYEAVASAAGRVRKDVTEGLTQSITDISAPVKDVTSFGIMQIVLVVAAVGVAVYYMGKSGGLRVNASV